MTARKIFLAGLLVGTLDIVSAFVDFYLSTGKDPLIVPKFIASAFFGASAYTGGASMIVLGLLLHYFIAFCFTLFFFFAWNKFDFLRKNWLLSGLLYGIFIWSVMNILVVPMTNVKYTPLQERPVFQLVKSALILICFIGIPLAFIGRARSRNES